MDQEGNNGRRRSSRLAARGIVTTPKVEIVVKKTPKSSVKPKRSKRKTTEEAIELPEAKKTKTEDKASSDEVDNPKENELNSVGIDISGISPMDVDDVATNVSPPSDEEKKDSPAVDEKTDVSLENSEDQEVSKKGEDSKDEEVDEVPVANVEKETDDTTVETEDEKPEIKEELIKTKEPEITEQPEQENDGSQDEPKQESPVELENTNGKSEENETIESEVSQIVKDIGLSVATKDTVTPNGDADEQVKSTNGDESITEKEAIEPIKVLHDDTNHVDKDIKAVTTTAAIITNNDAPIIEPVEKELDKAADNVVDDISVPVDDNAPKELSTVMS